MIGSIDRSNLAYIPASRPAIVSAASEEKELHSQSARAINYDHSISSKSPSPSQSSINPSEETENRDTQNLEDDTAKQQEQVKHVVDQLKARDREVRTHEMAHLSAAGSYAMGGMSLSYQRGPDGQQYAVGGSVQIDTSSIPGDPAATIQKGRVVQRAALAPAQPSGQDRNVASAAAQMIASAQSELMTAKSEERAVEESEAGKETDMEGTRASNERDDISKEVTFSGIQNQDDSKQSSIAVVSENSARMQFDLRMQVAAG